MSVTKLDNMTIVGIIDVLDDKVSANVTHVCKLDEVGKHEQILNITIYQVDFMSVEILNAFLDYVKREIFKSGFAGSRINAEQTCEVIALGGEKELVRFNKCPVFVFDGEIVKLLLFFLLMIRFNLVTKAMEWVTSCRHC